MESGDIPDENIQASSIYSTYYRASYARLNSVDPLYQSWYAATTDSQPWIQADIGYQTKVSGIVTQGHLHNYPTTFKVSTFFNSVNDDEVFVKTTSGNVMVNIYWWVFFENSLRPLFRQTQLSLLEWASLNSWRTRIFFNPRPNQAIFCNTSYQGGGVGDVATPSLDFRNRTPYELGFGINR